MRYNDSEKVAVRVSDSLSETFLRLEREASFAALTCDPFTLRAIRVKVVALRRWFTCRTDELDRAVDLAALLERYLEAITVPLVQHQPAPVAFEAAVSSTLAE